MEKNAILGYTGLVGSYIRESLDPQNTEYYNTKNFETVRGKKFNTVFCACVPAVKWKANQNPVWDRNIIRNIFDIVKTIQCQQMILISTIDVHDHRHPFQDESVIRPSLEAYGFNRYELENQLRSAFEERLVIVRLPALFGVGLKKNIIFDLINNNNIDRINLNSAYQWYPLSWLYQDIQTALSEKINVINLYPDAIETYDIICEIFPSEKENVVHKNRVHYRQKSRHEHLYMYSTNAILKFMKEYVRMVKYINQPNRMVVSNMAWDPIHDDHAIFLMKRYGIKNVELLPTKYDTWEKNFAEPTFHLKYKKENINIYSLQAVLYGVQADFINNTSLITEHLNKAMELCEKLGGKVIVVGSPKTRKQVQDMSILECEKIVSEVLDKVQKKNRNVKLCLEANAKEYGCEIGNDLKSCNRIAKDREFFLNFDTGNYLMEKDNHLSWKSNKVGHCQLSYPFLRPIHFIGYERFKHSDISFCIKNLKKDTKISLEIKNENITSLGEQFRRFATFVSETVI